MNYEKHSSKTSLKLAAVMLLLLGGAVITAHAQGARLQIDQLDSLANRGQRNRSTVKLDERLMATTAKIFSDKDDADIKEILKGLTGHLCQELRVREGRPIFASRRRSR